MNHNLKFANIFADETSKQRPPPTFDRDVHKVLMGELKRLYTATTRAKNHLWIYDEDEEKRRSMFQYFISRGTVKVSSGRQSNLEGNVIDYA